jgi:type VI protein secretion system component VasK
MSFAKRLLDGVRSGLGLIHPAFACVGDYRDWRRSVRWAVHLLFLVSILIGLGFLNRYLHLEELVKGPNRTLRDLWLPLLFLLFYLIGWIGWWLWRLLGPEEIKTNLSKDDRSKIDKAWNEAWNEALRTLNTERIDCRQLPLFLILDQTTSPTNRLLQASKIEFNVKHGPSGSAPPLHLYADKKGIYLICPQIIQDHLEYLFQLIARDRSPFRAVNGILIVFPIESLFSDEGTEQLSSSIQKELSTARKYLRVQCPLFFLVSDLERVGGCREFLDRLPLEEKKKQVGYLFPLIPDLDPPKVVEKMFEAIRATLDLFFNRLVYETLILPESVGSSPEEGTWVNAQLFRFLSKVGDIVPRVQSIIDRSVFEKLDPPRLYGGCFFAATGQDAREQAFVPEVFDMLIKHWNDVSWTKEALDAEKSYRLWTTMGVVAFLICLGALVSMLYWF